jgi:3-mercaptopyruvate sulfurtransferase SseA
MRKRKKQQRSPAGLIVVGVILLTAALALVALNITRPPAGLESRAQPTNPGNIPYPEIERVNLAEAKQAHDAGEALFLDVRSAGLYADSHIAGALNIPVNDLAMRLEELERTETIITYCT